ncbi:MAG: hypothetical protein NUV65_05760 [Candidatus Roizmanbacteria bacterium]|nr:hypothetical protein [Candidatus Roizmanbacteria bacterium]
MIQVSISKAGVNVLTVVDPNDFIFSSLYNTFKIIASGTYSPTLGTDPGYNEYYTSVAHGQSFTPFVIAFCKFTNSRVGIVGEKASNVEFWFTNLRVNGSSIEFGYLNATGGNYTPVFKYYICEVPL